ncbi:helix-turn-helix transcriptional regulator [Shewanella xiamenensis]|uniref:helix-turn-helix transcriptional regulator n=1 Tax=Shewanella xiamenensis TaxID=332186 RepID=UPI003CC7AFF8
MVITINLLGENLFYDFPKAVKLSSRSVAWVESEVQEWILERIAQRDGAASNRSPSC